MSEWQPIETAPKDGQSILLLNGKAHSPEALVAHWCRVYPENPQGTWHSVSRFNCEFALQRRFLTQSPDATHWMPLPEPPK